MFKESNKSPQYGLFSSPDQMLSGKGINLYSDKLGWHNLFYAQVTNRIDKPIFKLLYASATGSPNTSIFVLAAMMVLREAQGYSDAKLFADCRFKILIRGALGLINMNDKVPTEPT